MSERHVTHIDLETGMATHTVTQTDAETWEERVSALKTVCERRLDEPVLAGVAAVTCDGCGKSVELDLDDMQLPEGWRDTDNGDFCPECV